MADPASGSTPDQLRRRCRAARLGLRPTERERAESRIREHLLGLEELAHPGRLALFLPTDGEVDVSGLADELRFRGWVLHLPVIGDGPTMVFQEWGADTPLVANRFGIPEPARSVARDHGALDVVLVPCVAVDLHGNRLGFGKGYYDRALAGCGPGTTCVGVAYAVQVLDAVPRQDWDVVMDLVVTELGVTRPGPG